MLALNMPFSGSFFNLLSAGVWVFVLSDDLTVLQAELELLGTRDPHASASWIAGTTDECLYTQLGAFF